MKTSSYANIGLNYYTRLIISISNSMGFKLTPCCGTKRPSEDIESAAPPAKKPSTTPTRTTDSESIQINEVDQAGRFIEIKNLAPRVSTTRAVQRMNIIIVLYYRKGRLEGIKLCTKQREQNHLPTHSTVPALFQQRVPSRLVPTL